MNISQNATPSHAESVPHETEMWYPDTKQLQNVLLEVLRNRGLDTRDLTVTERQPHIYTSTSPMETVKCKLGNGTELHLLCKYGFNKHYTGYGHWGGVERETEVYRRLLIPLHSSVPTYYGSYNDEEHGRTWLILEWIDQGVRVNKSSEKNALDLAARWIGKFHSATESQITSDRLSFLKKYDADYYRGWAERTIFYSKEISSQLPWLSRLVARFEPMMVILVKSKLTIIHGEYTPSNILIDRGVIKPVDWESAAIAIGEIDLAQLTDNWSEESVVRVKNEYRQARWGTETDAGFDLRLNIARMFLEFRWLGERKEVTLSKHTMWRFNKLKGIGELLGLI